MRASLVFLTLFCIPFASLGNPRLDLVRDYYDATTQKHAKELIQTTTSNIESKVRERTQALSAIHRFSSSLMNTVNWIVIDDQASSQSDFKTALNKLLDVEDQLRDGAKKLSDAGVSWFATLKLMQNEEHLVETVSAPDFCQTQLDSAPLHLPEVSFPKFDDIDLSNIPKPQYKGVSAVPGRTDDDSDLAVEGGFMMAATTTGSAIGATIGAPFFGVGSIVGGLIGAGIGAIVGYCGGKGAVATKVALENQELRRAYNEACASEEQRQRQEIEEARAWITQNPLTKEVIRKRASHFCANNMWKQALENPISQLLDLRTQTHDQVERLEKSIQERTTWLNSEKIRYKKIRDDLEAREIADFKAAVKRPLLSKLDRLEQEQRILNIHEKAESTLFRCIADPQLLCAEKETCFFTTTSQLEESVRSFFLGGSPSEELKQFQANDWASRVTKYEKAITDCVK